MPDIILGEYDQMILLSHCWRRLCWYLEETRFIHFLSRINPPPPPLCCNISVWYTCDYDCHKLLSMQNFINMIPIFKNDFYLHRFLAKNKNGKFWSYIHFSNIDNSTDVTQFDVIVRQFRLISPKVFFHLFKFSEFKEEIYLRKNLILKFSNISRIMIELWWLIP